jgi:hypothetical protein
MIARMVRVAQGTSNNTNVSGSRLASVEITDAAATAACPAL